MGGGRKEGVGGRRNRRRKEEGKERNEGEKIGEIVGGMHALESGQT